MVDVNHHPAASPFWASDIREHWRLFLIEGIVLILLGIAAVMAPALASLAVSIFLGWLFLIGGVVGAVTTFMHRHARGFWWSLVSAFITILAGLFLVASPVGGAISLTIVLAAYLVADGVASMFFAYEHRGQMEGRWSWLFLNGVIDLFLAVIILWLLPAGALWALGLILGIDFLFGGASLIAMALAARHPAQAAAG